MNITVKQRKIIHDLYKKYIKMYDGFSYDDLYKIFYYNMLDSIKKGKYNLPNDLLTLDEYKEIKNLPYYYFSILFLEFLNHDYSKSTSSITELVSFSILKNRFETKNSELLQIYNEILQIYKDLSLELGISSGMELSFLFTYLLNNGYFSITHSNEYTSKENTDSILFLQGSIFNGNGVCRNYSTLLHDFLEMMGIENVVGTGVLLQSNFYKNLIDIYSKKSGNHSFNIINEDGQQYIFDSTNNLILNIKRGFQAVCTSYNNKIIIKPSLMDVLNLNSSSYDLLQQTKRGDLHSQYDYMKILEREFMVNKIISDNISLIDDAYDYAYYNISRLCRKYNRVK